MQKLKFRYQDRIASSSSVTADMIPDLVDYAVFSKEGKFLAGNLSNKEAFKAWDVMKKKAFSKYHSFLLVYRARK